MASETEQSREAKGHEALAAKLVPPSALPLLADKTAASLGITVAAEAPAATRRSIAQQDLPKMERARALRH